MVHSTLSNTTLLGLTFCNWSLFNDSIVFWAIITYCGNFGKEWYTLNVTSMQNVAKL